MTEGGREHRIGRIGHQVHSVKTVSFWFNGRFGGVHRVGESIGGIRSEMRTHVARQHNSNVASRCIRVMDMVP
jgi:hypothetical protein